MIEITEDSANELSQNLEKVLRHAGKAMQAIDDAMQQRDQRSGYRDNEWGDDARQYDDDRYGNRYGERRRGGGYSRYR